MSVWKIEHDFEVRMGYDSWGSVEYWDVTDGDRRFRCGRESGAKWLCDLLNAVQAGNALTSSTHDTTTN